MIPTELEPLIYIKWPNSHKENKTVNGLNVVRAVEGWEKDVPGHNDIVRYLNRTVVDNIFRWGPKYKRRLPVFKRYPSNFNLVAYSKPDLKFYMADAIYLLGKSSRMAN